jgi:hypothetical protein
MFTRKHTIVAGILVLIVAAAVWDKLHNLPDDAFAPQRWRMADHPLVHPGD